MSKFNKVILVLALAISILVSGCEKVDNCAIGVPAGMMEACKSQSK